MLNEKLTKWCETNDEISDTQNGFRKNHSSIDQLSRLTNIVETHRKLRKSNFVVLYTSVFDVFSTYSSVKRTAILIVKNCGKTWQNKAYMGKCSAASNY